MEEDKLNNNYNLILALFGTFEKPPKKILVITKHNKQQKDNISKSGLQIVDMQTLDSLTIKPKKSPKYDLVITDLKDNDYSQYKDTSIFENIDRLLHDKGILCVLSANLFGIRNWSVEPKNKNYQMSEIEGVDKRSSFFANGSLTKSKKVLEKHGYKYQYFFSTVTNNNISSLLSKEGCENLNLPPSFFGKILSQHTKNYTQVFKEGPVIFNLLENNMLFALLDGMAYFASKKPLPNEISNLMLFHYPSKRKRAYSIITTINKTRAASYIVKKIAPCSDSTSHIKNIQHNYNTLKAMQTKDFNVASSKLVKNYVVNEHIHGTTLEQLLLRSLTRRDLDSAIENLDTYDSIIKAFSKSGQMEPGLIDLNFDNIVFDDSNTPFIIDYEWVTNDEIPAWLIQLRAFIYFFSRHTQSITATTTPENPSMVIGENLQIPVWIYNRYDFFDDERINAYKKFEEKFQRRTTSNKVGTNLFKKSDHKKYHSRPRDNAADALVDSNATITDLKKQLQATQENEAIAKRNLHIIEQSRTWRIRSSVYSLFKKIGL